MVWLLGYNVIRKKTPYANLAVFGRQAMMRFKTAIVLLLLWDITLAVEDWSKSIALRTGTSDNESQVLEVKEWLRRHHLKEMSLPTKLLHQVSLLLTFLVASVAKYSILKSIWTGGPFSRPINIIIILEQFIYYTIWCIKFVIIVTYEWTQVSISKFLADDSICSYFTGIMSFPAIHLASSGFVAVMFRYVFLKWPNKVKGGYAVEIFIFFLLQ